jgi:hypothetical protein
MRLTGVSEREQPQFRTQANRSTSQSRRSLSDVSIFHIGAPFWGLVFGVATSWLVEQATLKESWKVNLDNNADRHHRC